ncbi:hypothetical protein [Oceanobacillus sp. J11TS1]|uniref:hypothetical protein n=1 Tax=Oceanobacillus sp. J11TS1 TaxID=2807191 RepID=UPI001B2AA829|nr:hypothetical protein [Oceanobacillus sp. J11TS1]GIO22142.1 hypothetical protein J11TS1_07230 [Oceanobacillus sp. J11TS1]
MFRIFKRKVTIFSMIFIIFTIMLGTSAISAEENNVPEESSSPDKYAEYLKEQSISSLSSDNEFESALETFNAMSKEEQEQYLSYINDPEVLNDMYEALASLEIEEGESFASKEIYGGDIKVRTYKSESSDIGPLEDYNYAQGHNSEAEIGGINVIRVNIYMQWDSSSSSSGCCIISSVNDATNTVIENVIPLQEVNATERQPYITGSGTQAVYSVLYNIRYSYEDIGTGGAAFKHEMVAYGTGDSVAGIFFQ